MGRLFRRLKPIVDRILYYFYFVFLKATQLPDVLRDRSPEFISDEIFAPAAGKTYAIVVKYAGFSLGDDFLELLKALRRSDINIIVVVNGKLTEAARDTLRPFAHRIFVRNNIGQDFGAYRAVTVQLLKEGLNPDRIIYCNDSIAYIKGTELDQLIQKLINSKYDVVGSFENHEYDHHIGSYLFSISGHAFQNPRVQNFWNDYRPYNIRPYVIKHGEIALSRLLKHCGYRFDVVYSAERLGEHLYTLDLAHLVELIRYTRPAFRLQPLTELMSRTLAARDLSRALASSKAETIQQPHGTPTIGTYALYRKAIREAGDPNAKTDAVAERLARDALVDRLMIDVTHTSQIHAGFGLFHRVLGAPLIKKDLLARAIYMEHDCALILDRLPAETRAALMRELVTRGRPLNVRGFRAFLLRHGLI